MEKEVARQGLTLDLSFRGRVGLGQLIVSCSEEKRRESQSNARNGCGEGRQSRKMVHKHAPVPTGMNRVLCCGGLRSHRYLRDLDTEVGLEGRVQIGIGADIGIGLDNNLGVLLDEEVNGGIESSANGLGGGTLLQSRGLGLDGGDGGAEEHGEHGQEEGEESGGLHDGDIRDVRVRRVVLREGDEVGSRW